MLVCLERIIYLLECNMDRWRQDPVAFTDQKENVVFLSSPHILRPDASRCVYRLSDIALQVANLREMAPQRPGLSLQPHLYSTTLTQDQSDIQTAGARACVFTGVPCLFTLRQNGLCASVPQIGVCAISGSIQVSIYQWAEEANSTAAPDSARSSQHG